jgi:hypothetical protein
MRPDQGQAWRKPCQNYQAIFRPILTAGAVKEITNGQPEDVVAFIERMVERNHWGGEEPYDKERAEQIRKAVEKARCDSLDSEEQALKRKYKGNKKVLDAIGKAKELVT